MNITVLFFATLKERTGVSRAEIQLPEQANVSAFKSVLAEKYPAIEAHIPTMLVSVNREFAFDQDLIPEGAEIAVFPPVSGGSGLPTICRIIDGAIDTDELVAKITLPSTGAACVFTGIVRGETVRGQAHTTTMLEYDAYIPMAEEKMNQVAREIRSQWPAVEGIAIVQRIGRLDPGTPTVWIACTAAHRDTGVFEASRYGIDRLKEIVPVWKKEIGPGNETWVEGGYQPQSGD